MGSKKKEIIEKPYIARFLDKTYKATWYLAVGGELQRGIDHFCKRHSLERWEIATKDGRYGHFAGHSDVRGGLFWFRDFHPGGGVVTHEAIHGAWWFIKEHMQCGLDDNVEELFAYYGEYLATQIGRHVW